MWITATSGTIINSEHVQTVKLTKKANGHKPDLCNVVVSGAGFSESLMPETSYGVADDVLEALRGALNNRHIYFIVQPYYNRSEAEWTKKQQQNAAQRAEQIARGEVPDED
jgi:phosphopantothenoylcysteine synthetase/decarboxylase